MATNKYKAIIIIFIRGFGQQNLLSFVRLRQDFLLVNWNFHFRGAHKKSESGQDGGKVGFTFYECDTHAEGK